MAQAVDHTEDLQQLVDEARRQQPLDDLVLRALHSLRTMIHCDLAALYRLEQGQLHAQTAVGPLASPELRRHRIALERFPSIRRALETRRPVPLHAHDHTGEEGDPHAGVLDLPEGHACMIVPLFAGDESLGIVTMECREPGSFDEETLDRAGACGRLISLTIASARKADLLDRHLQELELQVQHLMDESGPSPAASELMAASLSPAMSELVRLAQQVADSDMPVLLRGEHGTGKGLLARAIHGWSRRSERPFVRVGCSAASEAGLERELFGYVERAANGDARHRAGRLRIANHGTLLLEQIGALPDRLQQSILRVLERGCFTPVGSEQEIAVDVRIIATSSVDLEVAARAGRFRQDLYFRLAAFPLELPPLRDRPQDVAAIAERTLAVLVGRSGRGPWTLSPSARELLARSAWPGNVRELVNLIERASIVLPRGVIEARHLAPSSTAAPPAPAAEEPLLPLRVAERRHLEAALRRCGGKIYGRDGAAHLLELKPTTLQSKLKKHGIDRLEFATGDGGSPAEPSGRAGPEPKRRAVASSVIWPSAPKD